MTDDQPDDEPEYRPTDWLALCGMSYGVGAYEKAAIQSAIRYAGPFEDRDEPVSLSIWELYADSWQSHSPSGPERGAEWLSFKRIEIPADEADRVHEYATRANTAYHDALGAAETTEERINDDEGEPE